MDEELVKPLIILEFLKEVEGTAYGETPRHDNIPLNV